MTRVLAVRTRDGHYLEFRSLRAKTDKGEIEIDIDACVIAEILNVEEPPPAMVPDTFYRRDEVPADPPPSGIELDSVFRKRAPHRIDANGIDSREAFGQLGG